MNEFVWRIIYKNIDWKDWKPINRMYKTKGVAVGVLKRSHEVVWNDEIKAWMTLDSKLIFKLQSSELIWENYESK